MKLRDRIGQSNFFFTRERTREYRNWILSVCALSGLLAARAVAANSSPLDAQTQQQLQAIQDLNTQICLPAIEALGRSKNPAVVKPLADALDAEDRPVVRRYLVDALGLLRFPSALEALRDALFDSDIQVRQSAVAALGLLGTPEAQTVLVNDVSDEKNAAVKPHIIAQLETVKNSKAKEALKLYRNDPNPGVRKMATDALGRRPVETK